VALWGWEPADVLWAIRCVSLVTQRAPPVAHAVQRLMHAVTCGSKRQVWTAACLHNCCTCT